MWLRDVVESFLPALVYLKSLTIQFTDGNLIISMQNDGSYNTTWYREQNVFTEEKHLLHHIDTFVHPVQSILLSKGTQTLCLYKLDA